MVKKIIGLVLLFLSLETAGQEFRMEPMNWWVGMKNPELQLLIKFPNIGNYTVESRNEDFKITKINQAESPNYLFVDFLIKTSAKSGNYLLDIKDGEKIIQTIAYELKERRPNSSKRESFSQKDVIYLITPDRFANDNPENDGHSKMREPKPNREHMYGRHGGDLEGLINRLDYIRDMGFTAIWNMPVMENDQEKESYHGYAITDFYRVDPRFGTNEDYLRLSDEAEKRGIMLIKDVILNHCGDGHWWMKDKPFNDWIHYGGEFVSTTHQRQLQQDPHGSKADLERQINGWFVPAMPDLNQDNPFMAKYIIQNTIWWIEYANLGGIRIDTYPYSDKNFANNWCKSVLNEYPNLNMVGEEWTTNLQITSYWQKGKKNPDGYESNLPSVMDFPLQAAISEGLNSKENNWGKGLSKISEVISSDLIYPDPYNLVIFLDNHDMSRFNTQVGENSNLFKMGLGMIATLRGIPQIYYGTELAYSNPNSTEHGEIRKDFYGGWKGDNKDAILQKNLSSLEKESQDFVKKLLNWRKTASAIHDGKMLHFVPENNVYVYFRYNLEQKVMVLVNKNEKATKMDWARFKEILPKGSKALDIMTGEKIDFENYLVPGMRTSILEIL